MPIPEIPPILTETDWNKNKGAFARAAGKTGLGALLKDLGRAYQAIEWAELDVEAALEPDATKPEAVQALARAEAQAKGVDRLLDKVEAVEKLARQTQTKFAKHKLIPAASAKHVGKLADAAKTFRAELEKDTAAELAAFKKAVGAKVAQKPTVVEVAGEKWFDGLAKITLHRDPAVARWAFNAHMAASADDSLLKLDRRFDPRGAQDRFAAQLKKFRVMLEQLKALKAQRLDRREAVTRVQVLSGDLETTFSSARRSLEELLAAHQKLRGQAGSAYPAWLERHADTVRQTEQAFAVLEKQADLIKKLNMHAQALKRS